MITAVTGLNGAGKTAYAAGILAAWRKKGFRTAANISVDGAELIRDFDHLLSLRQCVVLIDEVTAVASSRQFASLTPEALLYFQTLRHSGCGLVWTAPTFDRCDLALRSLTLNWVHLSPIITRRPKGSIWKNTHLSLTRTGTPSEGMNGPTMLIPFPGLYRPARHWSSYDSFADVDLFSRVQRFPRSCPDCGVGLDYGRKTAVSAPLPASVSFVPEFYCPRCGKSVGVPVRTALVDELYDDNSSGVKEFPNGDSGVPVRELDAAVASDGDSDQVVPEWNSGAALAASPSL